MRDHPLGSGLFFRWEPKYTVDMEELPVVVELTVDEEGGRLVVTEFTARRRAGGPPVTVDVLRAIPVARLTASAVAEARWSGLVNEGGYRIATVTNPAGLDLDHLPPLERVAVAYRWGYFIGENPTQWVAKVLHLSPAVAAKRVQAARLAGLLEPTTRGRKGT